MTHYNLYYLLLEDAKRNPMPFLRAQEMKNFLEAYYEKTKPPWERLFPPAEGQKKI